mmetsp:Transcript_59697/g.99071  ORF Transcript_59697/g.99071 Transcript_59697/m.99071 type:complete len:88 (-) Transcript_59697:618-881(-)
MLPCMRLSKPRVRDNPQRCAQSPGEAGNCICGMDSIIMRTEDIVQSTLFSLKCTRRPNPNFFAVSPVDVSPHELVTRMRTPPQPDCW